MIEVSSLVALIVAEVMVGLLVLSGLLLLFTLLRKGRIRKAAAHLAERVKTDKVKREERLKALLEDGYHYEGAELEQILRNIMQTEMLLYQNVINGFLKDDQVHLQQIDVDVENLVLSYQGLSVPESTPGDTSEVSDNDDEVIRLKEENERLSEELRVTMDTMGRMLNEYSTMFSGGTEVDQAVPPVSSPEVEEGGPEDVETEQAGQEAIEQAPMGEPASIADSIMGDMPLDEIDSSLSSDTEIPDMSADELHSASYLEQGVDSESEGAESVPVEENPSLDDDAAEADEEVSEIIDEVMGMADAMVEDSMLSDSQGKAGESMVDDLEKIDIEIPDADDSLSDDVADAAQGSLEEEWAKLLEEDEASKKSD